MAESSDENYKMFKDCLSAAVLEKYADALRKKVIKRYRKNLRTAVLTTQKHFTRVEN
jgi:hypothetical protein